DSINGGSGGDILEGGSGNDTLSGQSGADKFVFNSSSQGIDTIEDFNISEGDRIKIGGGFGATAISQFNFNSGTGNLSFNGQNFANLKNVTDFNLSRDLILDGLAIAPIISNTAAGQTVNDNATVAIFSDVVIGDASENNITVTVTLDNTAKGVLTNLGGFTRQNNGSYQFVGSGSAVTKAIQGLVFAPTENRVAPGLTETTTFTIAANNNTTPVSDSTTTVVSTSVNNAPTNIQLSSNSVSENATGAAIGSLSTNDPDTQESFTYKIINNPNNLFAIDDNILKLREGVSLNYESGNTSYQVSIQTNDSRGLNISKLFTIAVTNVVIEQPTSGNDTIDGTSNGETILGLQGNDIVIGYSGNDTLNGGIGNDTLNGGVGNDVYVVDSAGDRVIEAANAGFDTVISTVNYTLGSNLERLSLGGAAIYGLGNNLNNIVNGNTLNNKLIGNGGNDTLNGGAGNDTLNGGVSNDLMNGGVGNDVYVVDSAGDRVIEAANAGFDTVISTVNYSLAGNVENLTLSGNARNGVGNNLNNRLVGNAANNILNGAAGNDILIGRGGRDFLTGGTGADRFMFNSVSEGIDIISDFNKAQGDKILINRNSFGATSTNQFSFNLATGGLLFKGKQFAVLQNINSAGNFITSQDILIV
ncbi:MAG: calcium-binding protein, partial [Prochloraceae cyanobacterium]|nr:calcium-binding protein [Prochloraceae cyanobacterium]